MSACSGFVQQAVCLLAFAMPYPLPSSTFLPPFKLLCPVLFILLCPLSIPCAPGSSSQDPTCLQAARLSRRQQQRGSAVAARAPCCVHHTITGAARLPVGSRTMGTAFGQPMRRCPLRRKKGRPRTAFEQPAKVPTPAFHEPETACKQPGSLLTFSLCRVHGPGPWVSVKFIS